MAKHGQYLSFNDNLAERVSLDYLKNTQEEINISEPLPLSHTWNLWVQVESKNARTTGSSYSSNTKELAHFQTVQEFWDIWYQLPQPSTLLTQNRMVLKLPESGEEQNVSALMIFKKGIEPMWEDPANNKGGHFECIILNGEVVKGQADEYWNNLVLALIGNTIQNGHLLTGVRLVDKLNPRGGNILRFEIWYSECDRESSAALLASLEDIMLKRVDGSARNKLKFETKSHWR